jgi:hypothetical protein
LSRVAVHIFVISRTLCKGFLWWLATPTLNKSNSPPRGSFAKS